MEKIKEFIKNNKYFLIIVAIIIIVFIVIVIVNQNKKDDEEIQVQYVSQLENIAKEESNVLTVEIAKKEEVQPGTEVTNHVMDDIYNGYPIIGKIQIPKTSVDIPIISSVSVGGMEQAPCLLYTTGELNVSGNTFIVGHNYKNGKLFSDNQKLEIGDKIIITTIDGNIKEYTTYNKFVTTSDDVSYLKREIGENPEITLQSCTDDNNDNRLIIEAR